MSPFRARWYEEWFIRVGLWLIKRRRGRRLVCLIFEVGASGVEAAQPWESVN